LTFREIRGIIFSLGARRVALSYDPYREGEEDMNEQAKVKYETPVVVALGELAVGVGVCGNGSSAAGSIGCTNGGTATEGCNAGGNPTAG
jgi:hypothetical protein